MNVLSRLGHGHSKCYRQLLISLDKITKYVCTVAHWPELLFGWQFELMFSF